MALPLIAQHDAKRGAILSQAAKLFNGRGSRSTTLLNIAQSLGLTKTSLYYYVKTKEALIYQCYMSALNHLEIGMNRIEREHSSGLARAQAIYKAHFEDWRLAQEGKRPHRAALLEIASLKDQHRKDVEKRYIEMFLRLRQYIRDGITEGSIRPCESSAVTLCIIGSIQWSFSWLRTIPLDQIDLVAAAAVDLLTNGLVNSEAVHQFREFEFRNLEDTHPPGFDREEQNRLKQDAFYKTGTWFFNKKGFVGTSLDEIAEHLNVTKGAFYYRIKNKEDLLYNCYARSLDATKQLYNASLAYEKCMDRLDYRVYLLIARFLVK